MDDELIGYWEIHLVAQQGDTEAMKRVILGGCNVNQVVTGGMCPWTALHIACMRAHLSMAKILLDNNADPNTNSSDILGRATPSALHLACATGYPGLVKLLVKRGANVNARMLGDTPMITALRHGYWKIAIFLLENGAHVVNVTESNGFGEGPLHLCHFPRLAKLLLAKGARVNALDNRRSTPLHLACKDGNLKIAKVLIDHKAKVNAKDITGRSPLHWAATRSNVWLVKLLIAHKACINSRDLEGHTPLHNASQCDAKVAKILLQHGAIVNARTKRGDTPLHLACATTDTGRQERLVAVLLDFKANAHAKDAKGECPLHAASEGRAVSIVMRLVAYDPTCRLNRGDNENVPLHYCGSPEIARVLLESNSYEPDDFLGIRAEPVDSWMAHEMFSAQDHEGQSVLDTARSWMVQEQEEADLEPAQIRAEELVEYLDSFKEEPLAVSGLTITRKRKRDEKGPGVKLNPKLNSYQRHLAKQTLKLVFKTPAYPVAYCVLGFLSAADVMKRQSPPV